MEVGVRVWRGLNFGDILYMANGGKIQELHITADTMITMIQLDLVSLNHTSAVAIVRQDLVHDELTGNGDLSMLLLQRG